MEGKNSARKHTVAGILAEPEQVFALIRELFPQVNWEKESLDLPVVREHLASLQEKIAGDKLVGGYIIHGLEDLVSNWLRQFQRYWRPTEDQPINSSVWAVNFCLMTFSSLATRALWDPINSLGRAPREALRKKFAALAAEHEILAEYEIHVNVFVTLKRDEAEPDFANPFGIPLRHGHIEH